MELFIDRLVLFKIRVGKVIWNSHAVSYGYAFFAAKGEWVISCS